MRAVFGVLSLLIVVAVIGLLAKRQLGAVSIVNATHEIPAGVNQPAITSKQQSQQLQNQVKKSVDAAMQQRRPEVDDK